MIKYPTSICYLKMLLFEGRIDEMNQFSHHRAYLHKIRCGKARCRVSRVCLPSRYFAIAKLVSLRRVYAASRVKGRHFSEFRAPTDCPAAEPKGMHSRRFERTKLVLFRVPCAISRLARAENSTKTRVELRVVTPML